MREMIDSIKASIVYQGEKRFIQAGVTEYEKGL